MKRSRLNLFKATSMTISLLGIILIIVMIGVGIYLVADHISKTVSSNVNDGTTYDQLSSLKQSNSTLSAQLNGLKTKADASNNKKIKSDYINAETDLISFQSAISDVDSGLSSNQPQDVINDRLNAANNQLKQAQTSINIVSGEI